MKESHILEVDIFFGQEFESRTNLLVKPSWKSAKSVFGCCLFWLKWGPARLRRVVVRVLTQMTCKIRLSSPLSVVTCCFYFGNKILFVSTELNWLLTYGYDAF